MKRVDRVLHGHAWFGAITLVAVLAALTLAACGDTARLTLADGTGPRPTLPSPRPARFAQGLFVGQHGTWNRAPHRGYQVVFVPFEAGPAVGAPLNAVSGFLSTEGDACGRPVGVALDTHGALRVADAVANTVWRGTSN